MIIYARHRVLHNMYCKPLNLPFCQFLTVLTEARTPNFMNRCSAEVVYLLAGFLPFILRLWIFGLPHQVLQRCLQVRIPRSRTASATDVIFNRDFCAFNFSPCPTISSTVPWSFSILTATAGNVSFTFLANCRAYSTAVTSCAVGGLCHLCWALANFCCTITNNCSTVAGEPIHAMSHSPLFRRSIYCAAGLCVCSSVPSRRLRT